MEFYEGYHFWGMHIWWWVFWIVLVIVAIYSWRSKPRDLPGDASPLEILQRRYVNGEISREEYEEKKAVLEEKNEEKEGISPNQTQGEA